MEKYLCMVIERYTKEQIGEIKVIEAECQYYARHKMADLFEKAHPDEQRDWCIDSIKID